MAGGLQAVHARHADVQQHEVGLEPLDGFDRLATVAGLSDHLHAIHVAEQIEQSLPGQRFVIDYQRFHRPPASGIRTVTVNSPRAGCTSRPPFSPKW